MINKEQYEILSKAELHFARANANWSIISSQELNPLIEVGNQIGIFIQDRNCSKCVLNFLRKLGREYEAYKSEEENKKKTQKEEEEKNDKETNKNKKGRPRKRV